MTPEEAVEEYQRISEEMQENDTRQLELLAKRLGLHVVTDADMRVLEAMAYVPEWALQNNDSDDYYVSQEMRPPIQAELARREAKR